LVGILNIAIGLEKASKPSVLICYVIGIGHLLPK